MDATGAWIWPILTVFLLSEYFLTWYHTGYLTGKWMNKNPEMSIYFIVLVLIGRYIISPYFSAVFLEAYLSASFRDAISLDSLDTFESLGKPLRKHLQFPRYLDNNMFVCSSYLLDLICSRKPTPSDLMTHVSWLGENDPPKEILAKVFDRLHGWKNIYIIVQADALFLCKESKKQKRKLVYAAILPSAKISVARSSTLIEEVAALGITDITFCLIITPHHAFDFNASKHVYSPIFLGVSDDVSFERLLSKIRKSARYRPSSKVMKARRLKMEACLPQGDRSDQGGQTSGMSITEIRSVLRTIVGDPRFEFAIAIFVILSVLSKSFVSLNPSHLHQQLIDCSDQIFQSLFAIEIVCRNLAIFPRNYFSQPWFVFDWLLVITFYVDEILASTGSQLPAGPDMFTRVQRLTKVSRTLSILRVGQFSSIAATVNFLCDMAYNSLGSFMVFLFVLSFSFSIIGLAVFGNMCTDNDQVMSVTEVQMISKYARCLFVKGPLRQYESFSSVELSMLTLFRVFTGDDWISIMVKCSLYPLKRKDNALSETIGLLALLNSTKSIKRQMVVVSEIQELLPGCQSTEELEALRLARYVDCSRVSERSFEVPCISNCGSSFAQFYFPFFFFASNSIIWNLVMATLIEGLKGLKIKSREIAHLKHVRINKPIIQKLLCRQLLTIYETWATNMNRKNRFEAVQQRMGMFAISKIRYSAARRFFKLHADIRLKRLHQSLVYNRRATLLSITFCSWKDVLAQSSKLVSPIRVNLPLDVECPTVALSDFLNTSASLDHLQTGFQIKASESTDIVEIQDDLGVTVVNCSDREGDSSIALEHSTAIDHDKGRYGGPATHQVEEVLRFKRGESRVCDSLPPSRFAALSRTVTSDFVLEASLSFDALNHNDIQESKPIFHRAPAPNSQMRFRPSVQSLISVPGTTVPRPAMQSEVFMLEQNQQNSPFSAQNIPVASTVADREMAKLTKVTSAAGACRQRLLSAGVESVVADSGLNHLEKLQVMRRALAMRPRNLPLLLHYAELLVSAGQVREAEAVLQRALEVDPHNKGALSSYLTLARNGGDTSAVEVLEELLRQATHGRQAGTAQHQPTSRAQAEEMLCTLSKQTVPPSRMRAAAGTVFVQHATSPTAPRRDA